MMDIADSAPVEASGPTETMILLPATDIVILPGTVLPLSTGRADAVLALQEAARTDQHLVVVLQREPFVETPGIRDLHAIGTEVRLLRYFTGREGSHNAIVQGVGRLRLTGMATTAPYPSVTVQRIEEPHERTPDIDARGHQLRERALDLLRLVDQAPAEIAATIRSVEAPGALADFVAGLLDLTPFEKQEILETIALLPRLDRVITRLAYRYEVLRLSSDIGQQTKAAMEGRQREFLLREQLKAIQKELGESDGATPELDDLKRKLDQAGMPEDVAAQANRELRRLTQMPEGAGEAGMVRSYLEWLTELPWQIAEKPPIDIALARRVLDEDHFGLEKIKRRILEFLSVRKLNPDGKGPILCFVGPPGVGKTSLGQSIARAMVRKFVRVSLGGVHDESEIRGHRRTYVGALPGNIIQAIRRAGERDCVVMLDEIDKLGSGGFQGDPASALLEVLDPEQNATFRDAYLGVPFDLSKVLFIATANMLDTIPGPLRDRMEVVSLSGYTAEEKLTIAREHLIPRQLKENGLTPETVDLDDDALTLIIEGYTREAGVRSLERTIGAVFRNVAMRVAEGEVAQVHVNAAEVEGILGPRRFESDVAQHASVPGVATGLAWTPVGGDILFIEASRMPGTGRLILTGQLGDVMKESAQAALSLLKTRAVAMGIDIDLFTQKDVHVHVPAGATPKDGPSAGVAMFAALASVMTERAIPPTIAMTGEISLRGLVLPVGGIREKVIAAAQAGIKTVMLPARNRRDYDDIPLSARTSLDFIWLETIDDAIAPTIGTYGQSG
ncbi:MAG TPA: endopeptidase La [Acidisoma sp.]|uniref:endopeptidase La n=1 Tax=Acidisoma sp. TaxID=1872115 RepID=UPI002BDFD585|nr:endopeptidase La [Acidisoma sp.]HTI03427.1 endopeptidase La [Acidisoma sp.]